VGGREVRHHATSYIAHWMRSEPDHVGGSIKRGERELGNKRFVGASGSNPARLEFGAHGGRRVRPRSNAESERRATQSESAEGVVGGGQPTIEVGLTTGDGEFSNGAVDAPSVSGWSGAVREPARRTSPRRGRRSPSRRQSGVVRSRSRRRRRSRLRRRVVYPVQKRSTDTADARH